MKQQTKDYAEHMVNTGAQEIPALRRTGKVKKGTAIRGKDLRNGK